jgi:3-isopropylmalate dehydrogenase
VCNALILTRGKETIVTEYRIALLPGDGIGPETMAATRIVLDRVHDLFPELKLSFTSHHAGAELYRQTGEALPREVLEDCLSADAVLLAAIGLPDVRQPDGTEVQPTMMVGLRRALGLHSAVRPVKLYPGVSSPLRNVGPGIDFIIIRENLEGLFASFGGGSLVGDQVATDTMVITRAGTSQVVDFAFRLSARRQGRPADGKRVVTCVDKANVFRSMAFFRKVFYDVAASFPDIDRQAVYVDAMSLYMIQNPWDFDVLVMENQFGDILSDLGAALVGGLGLGPSAEIGEKHGLFQPSHGTAPQIAGKNIANPLATILSASMMFDWLGLVHRDENCLAASQAVEAAVAAVLLAGEATTQDLGGRASTTQCATAVAECLRQPMQPVCSSLT